MEKSLDNLNSPKEQPDSEETVEEALRNRFDQSLMSKAMKNAKREEQAAALHRLLKNK